MNRIVALVVKGLRGALLPFIFFFVLFHLIALTNAVAAGDYSFNSLRGAFMTAAAFIVAKSVLLVEGLPIPRLFSTRLVYHILWRTTLFGLLAIFFRILEETIPLILKQDGMVPVATILYRETNWPHFAVMTLWLFAGLFYYCLVREFVRIVGAESVMQILFRRNASALSG